MDASERSSLDEFDRLQLTERAGGIRITVRVRPKASRSGILGVRETALEVQVSAPPADGQANVELRKVVAQALGVRKGDISIVTGASGRTKLIDVSGICAQEAREQLRRSKR